MFNNETIYLPCNSPNWKYVIKYITEISKYYQKLKSISDIIKVFREIKSRFEGPNNFEFSQDSFLGFGLFLEKYNAEELEYFINNNMRNILFYVQMVESLTDSSILKFSYLNNTVRISLATVKSLLACGVVCLLPHTFYNNVEGSSDQFVNIDFQDLYNGSNFRSENHLKMLQSILEYFSVYSKEAFDKEINTFITISLNKTERNIPIFDETTSSWPIILASDLSNIHNDNIQTLENIWPMYFEDINPLNYFNNLQFKSDRTLGTMCPFLVFILPLLTFGFADFPLCNVINISFEETHHTVYRILSLDHWNIEPQYSMEYILTNMIACVQAFECVIRKYQPTNSLFANNFTNSVIEDAIHKLNLNKSREIFASNRSVSNIIDSRKIERPSLSNIFSNPRRLRDTSISSSSSTSRSARQSYSTTSSSRSGSLQLSTFSSRRSSNISTNKDNECCNTTITDKGDFAGHSFHPIILEESNIQADDDECLLLPHGKFQELLMITDYQTQADINFDEIMSAPISDSTKLSISKDYLQTLGQKSPQMSLSKRRNSSPILSSLLLNDSFKSASEIRKVKMKQAMRCCEEDASNDRLASSLWQRSNSQGRRQSLPCHLQWLYQLPLTDSIKLNLSNSQILSNDIQSNHVNVNCIVSHWSDNFVENKVIEESGFLLKGIMNLANDIIYNIIPDLSRRIDQVQLNNEILKFRLESIDQLRPKEDNDNSEIADLSTFFVLNESLQTKDLASFDKELFSSTFFDNEALQYFSQISNYNVSNSDYPEKMFDINNENDLEKSTDINSRKPVISPVKNESLLNYANLLTESIIDEALISENDVSNVPFNQYADVISVDIIANSLSELTVQNKSDSKLIPPIYVGTFSPFYHHEIGMLIQILSASVIQARRNCQIILVCDCKNKSEMSEIIEILNQNKDLLNPSKVYCTLSQYCSSEDLRKQVTIKEFLLKLLKD